MAILEGKKAALNYNGILSYKYTLCIFYIVQETMTIWAVWLSIASATTSCIQEHINKVQLLQ